jgi:hypothetical protein
MICLLISIIATSLSMVNANDNFVVNNESFEAMHRILDTDKTKTASNKNAGSSSAPTASTASKAATKAPVDANAGGNQVLLKKKYTVDPLDILKGAGDFKFKTTEDLLKKWHFVNQTNYDITLK